MPAWVIVVFLVMFAIVTVAVTVGLRFLEIQQKKRVAGVVEVVKGEAAIERPTAVLRDPMDDDRWGTATTLLGKLDVYRHIEKLIAQAAIDWHPAAVLLAMIGLGALGAMIGYRFPVFVFKEVSLFAVAGFFAWVPYLTLSMKRNKRVDEFESQLPEALDFLARSLRAGHAFSVSIEMLAQESQPPLGPEFGKVFHEHNLGAPLDIALINLAKRVPLIDVRFFVSSVMLQRDTGGNLGEILTKLSYVIRERFRLKGQVRAASAHGRLTATVLILLPIVMTLALFVIAPGYLDGMAEDEHGKWMILGALTGQLLGFYFIRKIINIKV